MGLGERRSRAALDGGGEERQLAREQPVHRRGPELRELLRTPSRNCLKSPEGASNVASQGTEAPLFGPFRPRYTGQIHPRSVAQTPFQTVSRRSSQNCPSTHSGE